MSARRPITRPLVAAAAANDADDAGPANAGRYFVDAEGPQFVGDRRRRLMDVVEDFGMAMKFVAPGDDVILEIRETVDDWHTDSTVSRRGP